MPPRSRFDQFMDVFFIIGILVSLTLYPLSIQEDLTLPIIDLLTPVFLALLGLLAPLFDKALQIFVRRFHRWDWSLVREGVYQRLGDSAQLVRNGADWNLIDLHDPDEVIAMFDVVDDVPENKLIERVNRFCPLIGVENTDFLRAREPFPTLVLIRTVTAAITLGISLFFLIESGLTLNDLLEQNWLTLNPPTS